MTELTDLNLITYVIEIYGGLNRKTDLYVSMAKTNVTDQGSLVFSYSNLSRAAIFSTPNAAKKICKQIDKIFNPKVKPVSKKIFFIAALKGKR